MGEQSTWAFNTSTPYLTLNFINEVTISAFSNIFKPKNIRQSYRSKLIKIKEMLTQGLLQAGKTLENYQNV